MSIGRLITQSEARREIVASLPMIDREGPGLSPVVLDRLSAGDQRVVNGVLNPSDTILPESIIGDRGAIQITIDDFIERRVNVFDRALAAHDANVAQGLFQEGDDLEEAANAMEEQRIREETREAQEEDVSRLERIKRWFKENWLGASALGITVACLITTIIVGARTVIEKGAQATLSFAKAVRDAEMQN